MWRVDSLEKTLMLGKTEGRRRREWQRMRWLDRKELDMTEPMNWTDSTITFTELKWQGRWFSTRGDSALGEHLLEWRQLGVGKDHCWHLVVDQRYCQTPYNALDSFSQQIIQPKGQQCQVWETLLRIIIYTFNLNISPCYIICKNPDCIGLCIHSATPHPFLMT